MNTITLKLKEEKVDSSFEHMDTGNYFLNITPGAQTLRLKINKWEHPGTKKIL